MTNSPITSPLGQSERDATGGVLQGTLVDLIDLSLVAKQAHWNVVGRNFHDVHLHLDELVHTARTFTDQVAERASALGVPPDGRAGTVVEGSGLPGFQAGWRKDTEVVGAIVEVLDVLVQRMRVRVEQTDKTDLVVTQDLMITITGKLEEARWMWQAQSA